MSSPEERARHAAYAAEWRRRNPDKTKLIYRKHRLKKNFGLSVEEYEEMISAQGGVCAICTSPPHKGWSLAVDHCHSTGAVRGLLCHKCNRAIGALGDSPESLRRALGYLHRASDPDEPDERRDGFA